MKRTAMSSILTSLVSLATLFATGCACNNVPSMTWNDACLNSCSFSQAWTTLCEDTLKNAPPTAEVTVFALAAARKAKIMYESTLVTLDQMLGAGNMPADLRRAVDQCKVKHGEAHGLVASLSDQLLACDFSRARQEYLDAQVAIQLCHDVLSSFQSLPLYSMVSADYDMTMVAYELGALIVGKGHSPKFSLRPNSLVPANTVPDPHHEYQLCLDTLTHAPDTEKVTVYTLIVTRLAILRYEDTMTNIADLQIQRDDVPRQRERSLAPPRKRNHPSSKTNMKSAAAMTIVLAMLVSFATLFTACNACDSEPTMSWKEACLKVSTDPKSENLLCLDMLRNAPDTANVTVYALIITRLANLRYEDTLATMDQMLTNGTMFHGSGREDVENCKVKYGEAHGLMVSVADRLSHCDLTTRTKQDYHDAQVALGSCQSGLWAMSGELWVLWGMVSANFDLAIVAEAMGGLIFST
ncbi:hypothetical protein EJB05_09858, partial [Eragrostis curvula]